MSQLLPCVLQACASSGRDSATSGPRAGAAVKPVRYLKLVCPGCVAPMWKVWRKEGFGESVMWIEILTSRQSAQRSEPVPGLLGEIFRQGDRLKRHIGGLLSDPIGSMEQSLGLLSDSHNRMRDLTAAAYGSPEIPFAVTN